MIRNMKNFVLILFIVAIGALNCIAKETKYIGSMYLNDSQYQKARGYFQNLLKSKPNDILIYCSLGDAYIGLQNLDSAKIMYQKAFAIDPKNSTVLVNLGKMALLTDDNQSANDYFDKAKKNDRKNPAIYCSIAEACYGLSKKDTTAGKKYLIQGMEINSKYPGFHMLTGDWEAFKKNYGMAANAYERAIFFDSTSTLAYRKLGKVYADARFNRQALDKYNKCIEINPDQIQVYKDLGDLYYSLGRYTEAEKNYQIYMGKADVSFDDKERYAIILFFNKKYNEAASLLDNILTKNIDESVLFRIRGYIAYETGNYLKGLEFMQTFFKLHNPEKIISSDYMYYGRLLEKAGNDSLAMTNYKKALDIDSTKTELYENLANLSKKNFNHPQATYYYFKMLSHGADELNTYYNIGLQEFYEGQKYKNRYDSLYNLQAKSNYVFNDSTVVRDSMLLWLHKADTVFSKVMMLDPQFAGGYWLKGRIQSRIDPDCTTNTGRDAYLKAAELFNVDPAKNNGKIIECYKYLGSWYYINYDRIAKIDKNQSEEFMSTSIEYFRKVLMLDPKDSQALEVFKQLKIPLSNP